MTQAPVRDELVAALYAAMHGIEGDVSFAVEFPKLVTPSVLQCMADAALSLILERAAKEVEAQLAAYAADFMHGYPNPASHIASRIRSLKDE